MWVWATAGCVSGVEVVATLAGVAISTRLRTTVADEYVLDGLTALLGRLRRGDLAATSQRSAQRCAVAGSTRKKALSARSSSRWANSIIAGNDDQYRLAREAAHRHIVGLRAAITALEKRLAAPTADTLTVSEREARRKAK